MENNGYCVLNNVDLWQFNSMRVHANAQLLYLPYTPDGLAELCSRFSSAAELLIVGKGSNTIFSQKDYSRAVVCTSLLNGFDMSSDIITVQSGTTLSDLAWFAQSKSVSGYEFLEDIPGSVGGALFMNAGTYSDTIAQLVDSATVYDFESGQFVSLDSKELEPYWGKRKSLFQDMDCVIVQCRMKADSKGDSTQILEKMLEIKKSRYAKQPREYPSAGSVFKRPHSDGEPIYVWKLLEQAGLRGFAIGGACVSDKHPGFIVNDNNCTGAELVALLNHCKAVVKEKFNVDLEEEWRIV